MSFLDDAIGAHTNWKVRLLAAVNGGDVPDRAKVCMDNQCDLGNWIYGEGQKTLGQLPALAKLKEEHKHFHQCVGSVVDLVREKKINEAKKNILEGEFSARSLAIVTTIMQLKKFAH